MVTPECAPAVKTGGLGDVVCGLSRELELRGHAVEIILPEYATLREHQAKFRGILSRALARWFNCPGDFRNIVVNCMRTDHSWTRPGAEYLDIYRYIQDN
jgi:glycogen synthase